MKQDLATAYRQMKKAQTSKQKKESVEADPRSQTRKEKITDVDIAFSVCREEHL